MNPTRRSQPSLRAAKAALVGVAGLSLVLGSTPAEALPGLVAFTGTANVTPGLDYPILGSPSNGTWEFTIGNGVGATANGDVGTAVGSAAGNLGQGTLQTQVGGPFAGGAFCGASGGFGGSGSITVNNSITGASSTTYTFDSDPGNKVPDNPIGWQQSAGSLIFFTDANGAIPGANVIGLVIAIPPTPATGAGSCLSGTATQFTIVGVAVSLS